MDERDADREEKSEDAADHGVFFAEYGTGCSGRVHLTGRYLSYGIRIESAVSCFRSVAVPVHLQERHRFVRRI